MIHFSITNPAGLCEIIRGSTEGIVTVSLWRDSLSLNVGGKVVWTDGYGKIDKEHHKFLKDSELCEVWEYVKVNNSLPSSFVAKSDLPYRLETKGDYPKYIQSFTGKDADYFEIGTSGLGENYLVEIRAAAGRPVKFLNPTSVEVLDDAIYFDVLASAFNKVNLKQNMSRIKE